MKKHLAKIALLICVALLVTAGAFPAFAQTDGYVGVAKPTAEAFSPYNFSTTASASGTAWYQSGKITFKNLSNEALHNWVYTFDANKKLSFQNVQVKEQTLENGWYRYTVSAPKWETYVPDEKWTHKYAIQPGQVYSIVISGSNKHNIQGVQLTNCILSDDHRKPVVLESWKLKQTYKVGDVVLFNGLFYKARQAHTAHAFNWTPALTPALWAKLQQAPYRVIESTVY